MGSSVKFNADALKRLAHVLEGPTVRQVFENVVQEKAIAAIIGQGIAENFENEGPGWKPLKAGTIRGSVSKALRKKLSHVSDFEIAMFEKLARKPNRTAIEERRFIMLSARIFRPKKKLTNAMYNPMRKILQKTGLLKKSITTPYADGNIYKVEGTHIIWGTSLAYASVHQKGNAKKNIPARPYMELSAKWKAVLNEEVATRVVKYLKRLIREGLHK